MSKGLGGNQIEGRRAVAELIKAQKRTVYEVLLVQDTKAEEIVQLCEKYRISLRWLRRHELENEATTEVHQGVIARAAALPDYSLQDLLKTPEQGKPPFLLAFDGVTDPHNLGALLRTGECAGITGAILPKNRSVNITATVAKASAGAVEHVPMALVAGLPQAFQAAKKAGVWVVGLDPDGSVGISDLAVADQALIMVLGAEGAGLSRLAAQRCDVLASIPQYGSVASLNVAAAGAVACFEVARRRSVQGY